MVFSLVENALHSLNQALVYYHEADETENADQFKFCVLLTEHCAELLLKEILRRNHPSLVFENIDKVKDLSKDEDLQTVGFNLALHRVKSLCGISLNQYEMYLNELAKVRNRVQHYQCSIEGLYYKNLMSQAFSAIEYLFLDVLKLRFEDFNDVIEQGAITFLHEDATAYKTRKDDILKEFKQKTAQRFEIVYDKDKKLLPLCPICGSQLLSREGEGIRCKMCAVDFLNYQKLCNQDNSCINSNYVMRELGKRRGNLYHQTYTCPDCDCDAIQYIPELDIWMCLCCGKTYEESSYCDECGDIMPSVLSSLAMSDTDTSDYKYLCPNCTKQARDSEDYIEYNID